MFLSSVVLPAFGGETISARWPLPIGENRSMTRVESCVARGFELEALLGKDRRPFFEDPASLNGLGIQAVDCVNADQPVVLLALLGTARLALDQIAASQLEAAYLRLADVDVVVSDVVAGAAQEAIALGKDVEDSARHLDAGARDLRLHQQRDDLVFLDFRRRGDLDFEFLGDVEELRLGLLAELCRRKHRWNFYLRKLLVESGGMLPEVMAAARSAAASSATLLPHIVIVTLVVVGAMFGLQKSISLLEPHTSSFDD